MLRVFSLVVSHRETAVIELEKPVSDQARLCQQLGPCTESRAEMPTWKDSVTAAAMAFGELVPIGLRSYLDERRILRRVFWQL